MLGETYDILPSRNKLKFLFTSIGSKGAIQKAVLFQPLKNYRFNLAFGDVKDSFIDDKIISGNNDFVKVLATVAKCAYEFVETYPGATLKITPVDEERRSLYHAVFKRHWKTISKAFEIKGLADGQWQSYLPEIQFDEFELTHKF